MERGTSVEAGIVRRITDSAISLTVHYPPIRPVVTGSTPTTRPLNPLTGPIDEPEYLISGGVVEVDPVGPIPCLYYDARTLASTEDVRRHNVGTYVAGADVIVRVLAADVVADELAQGTVFDGCEYVECRGARFRVLKVEPIAAGFRVPVSLHVWLAGGQGQPAE